VCLDLQLEKHGISSQVIIHIPGTGEGVAAVVVQLDVIRICKTVAGDPGRLGWSQVFESDSYREVFEADVLIGSKSNRFLIPVENCMPSIGLAFEYVWEVYGPKIVEHCEPLPKTGAHGIARQFLSVKNCNIIAKSWS